MPRETLLLIFLAMVGVATIVQGTAMFIISRMVNRRVNKLMSGLERLTAKTARSAEQIGGGMQSAERVLRQSAVKVNASIEKLAPLVRDRTDRTGAQLESALESARLRLMQADSKMDGLIARLDTSTSKIQKMALKPTARIQPLTTAVRSALRYYVGKRLRLL